MKGTKGQHVVAQSYLRRFTADGERFFAFNKADRRVFGTNVDSVAKEAYFYDLPAETLKKIAEATGKKDQFIEKMLQEIDGNAKTDIDEVLERVGKRPITDSQRSNMAFLIAVQFSRTVLSRQMLREFMEKMYPAVAKEFIKLKFPDVADKCQIQFEHDPDSWIIHQVKQMLDMKHLGKLAAVLYNHIWVFGRNNTVQPLYTSDHPVVRNGHCSLDGIELTGFNAPGIEIAYPLSSKVILVMRDRRRFKKMDVRDGNWLPMDAHVVCHFNELVAKRAFRQVYCERDEFEQARGVCRRFPECCDPNRSRVEIVKSEDKIFSFFRE